MSRSTGPLIAAVGCALTVGLALPAADPPSLKDELAREVIGPRLTMAEAQDYLEAKVPRMPALTTAAEWEKHAERVRQDVLAKVVFRGAANGWRDAKTKVEWLDTVAGGPGYRIKKLRYEALPGLWVPALLYEPEGLKGKVPVSLAVNGHDRAGKAAVYKQVRCINQAKRGMLVLNVEWLGMGQLAIEGFRHYRMNQLDLCGTSGLAPFYLAMSRGLDVLLGLPNADPERVAVSGLSGGGWQTIVISSLDPRVTLSNPVAGYSSFRTRVRHLKDLGDSEQTPCDLATVADYTHLTALRAPRPTLLTFNSKDECCFESGYALPPLVEAAGPVYKLLGKEKSLRSHVNDDPGTHNYEKDNRQAFYRMLGDFFFAGDAKFSADEVPCDKEVKSKDELTVPLPADNLDFNKLALALAKDLPRDATLPASRGAADRWHEVRRPKLRELLKVVDYEVKAEQGKTFQHDGLTTTTLWKLKLGGAWTVPAVELVRTTPKGTTVLIADGGRASAAAHAERLLKAGQRVLAVDPFYFGESKLAQKDHLFALLVSAVGDRPLGLQAGQVIAVSRWAFHEFAGRPRKAVNLVADGPRTGVVALAAAGLEPVALGDVELHGSLGSLKEIVEQNRSVEQMPELFCFGLLEAFDVKQLVALVAPRRVTFVKPGERVKAELAGMKDFYFTMQIEHDPLKQ